MRSKRRNAAYCRQIVSLAAIWGTSTLFPWPLHGQVPGIPSPQANPGRYPLNPPTSSAPTRGPLPDLTNQPAQASAAPTRGKVVADVVANVSGSSRSFEMQKYIQTRTSQEFDPERVQGDVRRLIQSGLYRDVKTYTKDTPNGVIVIYEAFERPRIKYIKLIGNRAISDKKLGKEHGLKVGDALNAYNAEEARRKLEDLYKRNGFGKVHISLFEGDKSNDQGVVFYIDEGQVQRIEKVEFIGNTPELVTDARLNTQIQSKPGYLYYFFRGKVDREKIDADVEKLTAYYRSLGYFRARIARELVWDDANKWLTLRFVIDEGPRYVVRSVSVEGNGKFDNPTLVENLKIKRGNYFNQDQMNADVTLLVDLYGSQGHVYADVQADPRFLEEPGQLDLVYRIKEGDVFHVGEVTVHVGGESPHTRQSVVLNRVDLRPGDIIDTRKLKDSERRLKASSLFATGTNNDGEPPHINVKPPDLNSIGTPGKRPPSGRAVRAQTPEETQNPVTSAQYTQANNQTNLPRETPQQGPYAPTFQPRQ